MDDPNTTPDMEDNADTEVVVERKYILEVNVGTSYIIPEGVRSVPLVTNFTSNFLCLYLLK